ncbi:hypothetical protein K2173_021796 [Erythroxylum novogranatense]|uniref:C2H2-type domain-containing protein n=1 Tax=Erythroxylum novogranatense TaxID=1862640 RepID=A0AAV8TWI9_9ROSI|nr:hypothetical protein K2173_021796 [Erythroxylum novogranatense]
MANNYFNTLSSDPFGFNLEADSLDSFLPPVASGLGQMTQTQNHGFRGSSYHHHHSQLLASNPNNHGVSDVMTTPRSYPSLSHGQLGLNQRVTELRRTLVGGTPHRVQIHGIVEFNPSQNQQPCLFPTGEVTVTEIVRTTKFHTPASTLDRHFQAPCSNNNSFGSENHYNFSNFDVPSNYGVFCENQLLPNHNLNDLSNINLQQPTMFDTAPVTRHHCPNRSIIPPLMVAMDSGESNQHGISYSDDDLTTADEYYCSGDEVFLGKDGKTHSLPHLKYGPYTCPRCKNKFQTSQLFAAHMLSHYKNETIDERKRRLIAKYKRKNLQLCDLRRGTTSPVPRLTTLKIKNLAMKKLVVRRHEMGNNMQTQDCGVGEGTSGSKSKYVMINGFKIKEEP